MQRISVRYTMVTPVITYGRIVRRRNVLGNEMRKNTEENVMEKII